MPEPLVLIAGSSGFVGQALCASLQQDAVAYRCLVRRPAQADHESSWDPQTGTVDAELFKRVTVVVNVAGAGIADALWTKQRKQLIMSSRVESTRSLVQAINQHASHPCRLINASGLGYYGDSDALCDEDAPMGQNFLASVCQAWEAALADLDQARGHSSVAMRLGMVLGPDGGALAKMLPPMRWGMGGRLGSGKQWVSWVSRDDVVSAIRLFMTNDEIRGPVNLCAPQALPNEAFMRCLAKVLGKPFWAHVPAWILRLRFGQMAKELLLASSRACPNVLQSHGFVFKDPDLEQCLQSILE